MVFDIIEPVERSIPTRITALCLFIAIVLSTPLQSNAFSQLVMPGVSVTNPYEVRDDLIDYWFEPFTVDDDINESVSTIGNNPDTMEKIREIKSSPLRFDIESTLPVMTAVAIYQTQLNRIREIWDKNRAMDQVTVGNDTETIDPVIITESISETDTLQEEKTSNIEEITSDIDKNIPVTEVISNQVENITTQSISEPETKLVVDAPRTGSSPNFFDVSRPSGLTGAEIDRIMEKAMEKDYISKDASMMYGKGEWISYIEKKYNINALQLIATSCTESGYGTSWECSVTNNPFGMMRAGTMKLQHFPSIEYAIESWAGLMRSNYLDQGLVTIESINSRYAPGNTRWGIKMNNILTGYCYRYKEEEESITVKTQEN